VVVTSATVPTARMDACAKLGEMTVRSLRFVRAASLAARSFDLSDWRWVSAVRSSDSRDRITHTRSWWVRRDAACDSPRRLQPATRHPGASLGVPRHVGDTLSIRRALSAARECVVWTNAMACWGVEPYTVFVKHPVGRGRRYESSNERQEKHWHSFWSTWVNSVP
jgi:hypothetical protein